MKVTSDEIARSRIRTALGETMFVEAGAGSGKTTELVRRIVNLVVINDMPIGKIVAITFTEKAAGELADRVRSAFEKLNASDSESALAQELEGIDLQLIKERCDRALANLDQAVLTTIHGFARRILEEFPIEARLPPRFEVADGTQAALSRDERVSAYFGVLAEAGMTVNDSSGTSSVGNAASGSPSGKSLAPSPLAIALALGISLKNLREIANRLDERWDLLADEPPLPSPPTAPIDIESILAPFEAALARTAECSDPEDKLLLALEQLRPWPAKVRRAASSGRLLDQLVGIGNGPGISFGNYGSKKSWDDKDEIHALIAQGNAAHASVIAKISPPILVWCVSNLSALVIASANDRRRQGVLEFRDLLVLARDLVTGNLMARNALSDRYAFIAIDEFQDTDPLQFQIAFEIAGAEPGRLFVVADPKQSIYRFSGADLDLYQAALEKIGVEPVHLSTCYRSVPGVLDIVNAVFADLMVGDQEGIDVQFRALDPFRERGPWTPVHVIGEEATTGASIGDVRRIESAEIATWIAKAVADRWQVPTGPPADARTRDVRFSDIAILIRSRTPVRVLEGAFDAAGIPVRLESRSLIWITQEVRDLVVLLSCIADPTDQVAVVAALRSPAYGCTDDELMEFHVAGGQWSPLKPAPSGLAPDHRVACAMSDIASRAEDARWESSATTVERAVRERLALEVCCDEKRPGDHWRRIQYVVDQARSFDDRGKSSLRGFVAWLNDQAEERKLVAESITPDTGDDAVKILTMHSAKGLEFPIVILADLSSSGPTNGPRVLFGPNNQVEISGGSLKSGLKSAGFQALADREKLHNAAETSRLLYVAMTRAKDHLVISLHRKFTENGHNTAETLAQRLRLMSLEVMRPESGAAGEALDGGTIAPGSTVLAAASAPSPGKQRSATASVRADTDVVSTYREWLAQRQLLVDTTSRSPVVAATALASEAFNVSDDPIEGEPAFYLGGGLSSENAAPSEPWRRGRAGSAIGRAVHAVLQSADLATGSDIAGLAEIQSLAEGIPERAGEIAKVAESARTSTAVVAAIGAKRWWREVPVGAEIDGVVIEGYIDLLAQTDEGLVVIDYKTDAVPNDEAVEAAVAKYRIQLAAYALALEATLAVPVVGASLIFARKTASQTREITDLGEAKTEALTRLRHQFQ